MVTKALETLERRLAGVTPRELARRGIRATVPIGRYREGFVGDGRFRQEMASLAYSPEEIEQYLVSAKLDFDTTLRSQLLTAYRDAFRKDRITIDRFRERALALGVVSTMVDALVTHELSRRKLEDPPEEEKELRAMGSGVVIRRFREGITWASDLYQEMASLGYLEREVDRYRVLAALEFDTNLRLELLAAYRSGFRTGRLTESQFHRNVRALGIRPELAGAYLDQETMRRKLEDPTQEEVEVRAMGSGVAVRRFREGWTTLEEFREEMRALTYTDPETDRYAVIATLEFDYDYKQDLLAFFRDAFRRDEISADQFLDRLVTMGMQRDRALLHLSREQVKKGPSEA